MNYEEYKGFFVIRVFAVTKNESRFQVEIHHVAAAF
jgi:hypothetical protein